MGLFLFSVCISFFCHRFSFSFQGRFEIISLTGSFFPAENNGCNGNRASGLCISLAGSDGRVLGGGVYGPLTAAMPVQVSLLLLIAHLDGLANNLPFFSYPTKICATRSLWVALLQKGKNQTPMP